jgi:hypothetical protein
VGKKALVAGSISPTNAPLSVRILWVVAPEIKDCVPENSGKRLREFTIRTSASHPPLGSERHVRRSALGGVRNVLVYTGGGNLYAPHSSRLRSASPRQGIAHCASLEARLKHRASVETQTETSSIRNVSLRYVKISEISQRVKDCCRTLA